MKRRVADLKGANLRRAIHHRSERFQHVRIGAAAISVRVLFLIPQTDGYGFPATRDDEREFVLEPFLLAEAPERPRSRSGG